MALEGVRVGPLDPDKTSEFGQVSANTSARQLIRLHSQMNPPELRRALALPLDVSHTTAAKDSLDEIAGYVDGLKHSNGDPLVPEGAELIDASVRGHKGQRHVLTFQYRLPSGRIGKWFAPYGPEDLPATYDQGAELSKVKQMRDRGVVAFDSEGTHAEILQRQLNQVRRENSQLRRYAAAGGEAGGEELPEGEADSTPIDTRASVDLAEENERLGRENQEMRERLASLEALAQAQGGGVPTAGLEAEQRETVATAPEPVEGYDSLKADQAVQLLKSSETTNEQRQAILDYERTHANRATVVRAGDESLNAQPTE